VLTRRREIIAAVAGAIALPCFAHAQQARPRARIGMLLTISPDLAAPYVSALLAGMRELGYAPDREDELLVRYSDGYVDRLPALARDLVARQPAVIVTGATAATLAVAEASPAIPIVCAALLGSVRTRLPEQVSGVHTAVEGLAAKQLELLSELVPGIKRIGHLTDVPGAAAHEELMASARALSVTIVPVEVRTPADLVPAFETLARERVGAFLTLGGAVFLNVPRRIVALAVNKRLPSLYASREFVEAGGLMSFSVNLRQSYRRAATYVDKLLKGDRVGDLPPEAPIPELLINLHAAKVLNVSVPAPLLARADEVMR
jgi:putative tryptophan/tyrosine transport system substrate-binding protein